MSFSDVSKLSTSILLAAIGLAVTGISGRILELINSSPEFYVIYQLSSAKIALTIVVLGFVLPVIVGTFVWFLARTKRLSALAVLLLFMLLTIVISGALRDHSDPTGGWLLLTGAAVFSAIIIYAFIKLNLVRFSLAATALYLPISMYQSVLSAGISFRDILGNESHLSQVTGADAKTLPNVLFIVLDEFPITTVLGHDGLIDRDRFPNLRALADQSDWFRQASSVSCNTVTAVPAIQSGKLFGSPPESVLPLVQYYPKNVFTVLGESYNVEATETITQLCPDYLCQRGDDKRLFNYQPLFEHLVVAWLHASFPKQMKTRWPDLDDLWMNAAATQDTFPKLNKNRYSIRFDQMKHFIDTIGQMPEPWLKFGHFLMPHAPFQSTGSGSFYYAGASTWAIDDKNWTMQAEHVYQSYARHIVQAQYADSAVGEMIAKLLSTGQYDNTLIALVADHGVSFVPGDARRRTNEINFPNLIGVPMFIKEPGQTEGMLIDEAVQTVDMFPTILGRIDLDSGKIDFDGRDVLASKHESISERLHYCNKKGYSHFPVDLLPYLMDEVKARDRLFGTRPDGELEFLFAPKREWLGQNITDLGAIEQSPAVATIRGLAEGILPMNLDGKLDGVSDVSSVYIVATLNGKVASVMPLVARGKINNVISSFLLPRLNSDGSEVVELYATLRQAQGEPVFNKLKIFDAEKKKAVDQLHFVVAHP